MASPGLRHCGRIASLGSDACQSCTGREKQGQLHPLSRPRVVGRRPRWSDRVIVMGVPADAAGTNPSETGPALATPRAGDVFLHEIVLPGESSGGQHLCVCLSSEAYAKDTGMAVLASLRRVRSSWWRPLVDISDYSPKLGFLPLDGPRAVDTSQMVSVSRATLTRLAGVVSHRVLSDAMTVVPALFQLQGPWEVRGAVHSIIGWPEATAAVLVLNDNALDNPDVRHYLVVPYEEGWWRRELVLISADDLGEELRVLSDAEQSLLSNEIASMFPLIG